MLLEQLRKAREKGGGPKVSVPVDRMSDCRRICESLASYVDGLLRPRRAGRRRASSGCVPLVPAAGGRRRERTACVAPRGIETAGGAAPSRASLALRVSRASARRVGRSPGHGRTVVARPARPGAADGRRHGVHRVGDLLAGNAPVRCVARRAAHGRPLEVLQVVRSSRQGGRRHRQDSSACSRSSPADSVHIPPSSTEDGVQLLGARRCLYGDGIVPHVMYRVNGAGRVTLRPRRRRTETRRSGHAGPSLADLDEGRDDIRARFAGRC